MSRKVSSSAPSAALIRASSTGSPASRRFSKLTPLTTRPSSTSRQGMTRTATLMRQHYRVRSWSPEAVQDPGHDEGAAEEVDRMQLLVQEHHRRTHAEERHQ